MNGKKDVNIILQENNHWMTTSSPMEQQANFDKNLIQSSAKRGRR